MRLAHVKSILGSPTRSGLRACETIDEDTDKMIDGIAFHWYTGDHFEAVNITHELFLIRIFTEGCVVAVTGNRCVVPRCIP